MERKVTSLGDCIMHNVDSQDARDLMPGLEALLKELKIRGIHKDLQG